MKKLIPMMVAAAGAFSVFAEGGLLKTEGFEKLTAGDKLTLGSTWTCEDGNDGLTVTAYDKSAKYEYTEGDKLLGEDAPGDNNLAIDNTKPLYNNVNGAEGQSIATSELYIDTLVKFTVTDADTTPEADTNAKLAIWLQEAKDAATTNLMLRCGTLANDKLTETDIALDTDKIDADVWHRLTVRAINSKQQQAETDVAAFEVFLDGKQVKAGEQSQFLACVNGTTLKGVGFKGNGSIDDVAFADAENAPSFAVPAPSDITVTWTPAEIAGLAYGETTLTPEQLDEGTIDVAPGTTFTVTFAEGYMGDASQTFAEAGEIVAQKILFTVGEDSFATLEEALAAAAEAGAGTVVTLATADLEEPIVVTEGEIVLDLNGNAITVGIAVEAGTVTIISKKADASVTVADAVTAGETAKVIFGNDDDTGVTYNGVVDAVAPDAEAGNWVFNKGTFSADNADESGAFQWADFVAEGLEAKANADGSFTIQEQGEPEVEVTVSVTIENATATVSVADGAKVKAGDVITVTDVAAAADYKNATVTINGEAVTEYTVTGEEESIAIVVSATAITYATVTITQVENCTITVKNGETAVETGAKFDVDDEVVLTVTRTPATGYELDGCAAEESVTMTEDQAITAAVKAAEDPIPGEDVVPEDQKTAYDEWAAKTGVTTSTDKALGANLATAFLLGVEGTATPEAAIDAGKLKVAAYEKDIDFAALASGEGDALEAINKALPEGLVATLVPVEKTEIDTTASLFRLAIQPAK